MKVLFYSVTYTILLGSCQSAHDHHQPKSKAISSENASAKVDSVSNRKFSNFDEFWASFRMAVMHADTTQIIALTQFPLETRGPLDDDPIIPYDRQAFPSVFRVFLNQWNGRDLEGTTERTWIRETARIKKEEIEDAYTRLGNLVFQKTGEGWRLVFIYLNGESIDSTQKFREKKY